MTEAILSSRRYSIVKVVSPAKETPPRRSSPLVQGKGQVRRMRKIVKFVRKHIESKEQLKSQVAKKYNVHYKKPTPQIKTLEVEQTPIILPK